MSCTSNTQPPRRSWTSEPPSGQRDLDTAQGSAPLQESRRRTPQTSRPQPLGSQLSRQLPTQLDGEAAPPARPTVCRARLATAPGTGHARKRRPVVGGRGAHKRGRSAAVENGRQRALLRQVDGAGRPETPALNTPPPTGLYPSSHSKWWASQVKHVAMRVMNAPFKWAPKRRRTGSVTLWSDASARVRPSSPVCLPPRQAHTPLLGRSSRPPCPAEGCPSVICGRLGPLWEWSPDG